MDDSLRTRWREIACMSAIYDSPYYQPEYSLIAAQCREESRLLVCEDGSRIVGFLPFHRRNNFQADAVGQFLSDYQGPVHIPDFQWPLTDMLRAMKVRHYGFNHMPLQQKIFSAHAWTESRSLLMNLSGGFDAYSQDLTERRDASLLKKTKTNERKLQKKVGSLRFVMHDTSEKSYLALLHGKSEQFIRTVGADHDIFAMAWVRQMLNEIRRLQAPHFAGMLSTLYAGDELIAAHFGMRSHNTLHYWFPWYSTTFAEYSPGLILLAQCGQAAHEYGITKIDLGRGEQAYKMRFANDAIPLCEGAISSPSILSSAQSFLFRSKQSIKVSAIGRCMKKIKQGIK
ncbi:GNAT family N-acetyltransferase [Undibacterium sp. SXout7W]|uniref:GNAT family N-acetyltransferase n=1 Tax=Undibacterium sp. SXout7W TaxID=3413049 RepID=UPI003BF10107